MLTFRSQPSGRVWFGFRSPPSSPFSGPVNLIHDLNLADWRLAMSFCRSWTPLSALTEPANGKVQCLLASWSCQLWLVYSIPPFLREWEGSIQTESTGFSLVFIGKTNWHECSVKPAQAVWADAFLCFFLFIFQQINA